MQGESGISLTGLYIFGAITFVMLVLKLSVIDTWLWWRTIQIELDACGVLNNMPQA